MCTFDANTTDRDGRTRLTVGGLQTWKTTQSTVYGFIPVGPKLIAGYAPYRHFLDEVAIELRAGDPAAEIVVQ